LRTAGVGRRFIDVKSKVRSNVEAKKGSKAYRFVVLCDYCIVECKRDIDGAVEKCGMAEDDN
jgi:hypothetical protein